MINLRNSLNLLCAVFFVTSLFPQKAQAEWLLVFEDNFQNAESFNKNWTFEEGFKRNEELQYYVSGLGKNAVLGRGGLVITAKKEIVLNDNYYQMQKVGADPENSANIHLLLSN